VFNNRFVLTTAVKRKFDIEAKGGAKKTCPPGALHRRADTEQRITTYWPSSKRQRTTAKQQLLYSNTKILPDNVKLHYCILQYADSQVFRYKTRYVAMAPSPRPDLLCKFRLVKSNSFV